MEVTSGVIRDITFVKAPECRRKQMWQFPWHYYPCNSAYSEDK